MQEKRSAVCFSHLGPHAEARLQLECYPLEKRGSPRIVEKRPGIEKWQAAMKQPKWNMQVTWKNMEQHGM